MPNIKPDIGQCYCCLLVPLLTVQSESKWKKKAEGALLMGGGGGGGAGEAGIQYHNSTEGQLCHLSVCYYDSANLGTKYFPGGVDGGHKILRIFWLGRGNGMHKQCTCILLPFLPAITKNVSKVLFRIGREMSAGISPLPPRKELL